jgi:hypothetical protein
MVCEKVFKEAKKNTLGKSRLRRSKRVVEVNYKAPSANSVSPRLRMTTRHGPEQGADK